MNVIQPKNFNVFYYAQMAKTIDHPWWTYGPINCVGPNFLATAIGCAGWEFHHIKPLFDSAKSITANPDPVPLKRGNRQWKRVIVVDGLTIYMGVLLFKLLCSEYHIEPRKETITKQQFVDTFKKFYPNVLINHLDDEGCDDIWVVAIGYWDASRILYSRSNQSIRMWRNYGRYDYHFKSLKEFENWLEIAHSHERKFEEIAKV